MNKIVTIGSISQRRQDHLITGIVKIFQAARLAGDYNTSDAIREVLKESGVEIIPGTAGYKKFEDVPKHMIGRPSVDTWKFSD